MQAGFHPPTTKPSATLLPTFVPMCERASSELGKGVAQSSGVLFSMVIARVLSTPAPPFESRQFNQEKEAFEPLFLSAPAGTLLFNPASQA